jgi:lysophospholipase L1-like esterase
MNNKFQLLLITFFTIFISACSNTDDSQKLKSVKLKSTPKPEFHITFDSEFKTSNLIPPENLKVQTSNPTNITITWDFTSPINIVPEGLSTEYGKHTGFRIYRDGLVYTDTLTTENKYTDDELYPGESYSYKVAPLTFNNKTVGLSSQELTASTKLSELTKEITYEKKIFTSYLAEGDSITEGQRALKNYGWVDLVTKNLSKNNQMTTKNFGVTGAIAKNVEDRIGTEISQSNPDLITVAVGLNDLYANFAEKETMISIDKIAKIASPSSERKVILLGIYMMKDEQNNPELTQKRKMWSKSIRDVAYTNKIRFIDIGTTMENSGGYKLLDDLLHPNMEGHEVIANEVLKNLK